jgi:ferredoxin
MAYKITGECITCGLCARECQNDAISEGEDQFVIDPEKCTECIGAAPFPKCVGECTTGAIQPDPERQETKEQLLARWQTLHPGRTPKLY